MSVFLRWGSRLLDPWRLRRKSTRMRLSRGVVAPTEVVALGESRAQPPGPAAPEGVTSREVWQALDDIDKVTIEEIVKAAKSLAYGQIVLLVRDGRVVQIDRTEKLRLR